MNRKLIYALTAVIVIVAAVVAVFFTPLFTVQNFQVQGQSKVSVDEVVEATNIREGDILASVDAHRAANDVAQLPWVAKATVSRSWPDTIVVDVSERQAVLYVHRKDGDHLVDTSGTAFLIDTPPDGSVEIRGTDEDDPELFGKLSDILENLGEVRGQVEAIEVKDPYDVVVLFDDGRVVEWGAPENNGDKAVATRIALQREGQRWNVSDPIQVTMK
ncbi:cell division protein FtsQ/DivIB [Corynebacterium sp.]|uniref:cell division protein FtsQ/DivIB n=1 Tax=Corynebacterium sp. TaxID=1720 RepID=UPI0026DA75B0|nr:FtsQ-type POTRA domain-containing protein [Corynebacterium sp.]MDO5075928.1 FtsQ-type POTRA domain-containing protein [Corynebacterium sp.]